MDEAVLSELILLSDEFRQLEQSLTIFCPFEAVGMVRQEIRHGHFLSYVLDPQRPHGFGSACLKALLSAVARLQHEAITLKPLDVHLMECDLAIVKREWQRIDLLVELQEHKLVIAIELKIDADEHGDQMLRYTRIMQQHYPDWQHLLLFLTPDGAEPSDEAQGAGWLSFPFETLTVTLDDIVRSGIGNPDARSLLAAYQAMLRKHHLMNERLEELAASLWSRHKEALEFLMEHQPSALSNLMSRLLDSNETLLEKLREKTKLEILLDHKTPNRFYLAVGNWDELPDDLMKGSERWTRSNRLVLAETFLQSGRKLGVAIYLGRGDANKRQAIFEALRDGGAGITRGEKLSGEWKTLASKTLLRLKDDTDQQFDADKIQNDLVDFLASKVTDFDKAFRKHFGARYPAANPAA